MVSTAGAVTHRVSSSSNLPSEPSWAVDISCLYVQKNYFHHRKVSYSLGCPQQNTFFGEAIIKKKKFIGLYTNSTGEENSCTVTSLPFFFIVASCSIQKFSPEGQGPWKSTWRSEGGAAKVGGNRQKSTPLVQVKVPSIHAN